MCGIAGIFDIKRRDNQCLLADLNAALTHRGPDSGGIWFSPDRSLGLAHRRLAIIDVSEHGRQPMISASGRFITVFNGEIYNFRELTAELRGFGHRFNGGSDTEVMLAAFEQWGIKAAVQRFDGMFAAAVWDSDRRRLYIFRDRIGVKPLYYQWRDQAFYFSSELTQPLTAIGETSIDREALALYFRHNFIPAPLSIYKGIFKLIPGVVAELSESSVARGESAANEEIYWSSIEEVARSLKHRDESLDMEASVDLVEAALSRSVRRRMISDVPLGAFLSGGVDSSLVVAHMQSASQRPVRTFTIGFNERLFDEASHARAISKHLGTDHTELIITEQDALDVIPKLPSIYGEPFADSSQIPTFLVSQLTRRSVTVALSGDGGDELFAGYQIYQNLTRIGRYLAMVPAAAFAATAHTLRLPQVQQWIISRYGDQRYEWLFNGLRLFAGERQTWIPRSAHARSSMAERLVTGAIPGASVLPYQRRGGTVAEQKMTDDLVFYLPNDILTKVDRASMAVSLEVRVPFIDDPDVFRTAWSIPFRHKTDGRGGKLVLKQALARYLPRALFERPKMGFAVPLGRWLNGPLLDWVQSCVDPRRIRQEGILHVPVVQEIIAKTKSGNEWHAYKLWAICLFQSWLQERNPQKFEMV